MATHPAVSGKDGDVRLAVRAQPGAKVSQVTGMHGDRLKIAVHAPPVDGKANAALCAFVAEWLGVPKRAVTLGAGEASRDKRLDITADLALVQEKVATALGAT
jgi:uncharacterized protein (TIGR00251 family)